MIYDEEGTRIKSIQNRITNSFVPPFLMHDTFIQKPKYPRVIKLIKRPWEGLGIFFKSGLGLYKTGKTLYLAQLNSISLKKPHKNIPPASYLLVDKANSEMKIVGRNCDNHWVKANIVYKKTGIKVPRWWSTKPKHPKVKHEKPKKFKKQVTPLTE